MENNIIYCHKDIPENFRLKLKSKNISTLVFENITDIDNTNIINGLVIRNKPKLTKNNLSSFKNLKFIGRFGSGVEHIDKNFCAINNIKIINAPEGNGIAVGEFCLGSIISLLRNINLSNNLITKNVWKREELRGYELSDMTIGIIGYGNTGSSFAFLLSKLGCKVLVYDIDKKKYKKEIPNINFVNLKELKEKSNIISVHIPYSANNHNLIDEKFINSVQNSFYFINSSRGNVANINDVIKCMKTKKIKGVCLDVFNFEKNDFDKNNLHNSTLKYLINSKKSILTSHIAGLSKQSLTRTENVLSKKIIKFLNIQ